MTVAETLIIRDILDIVKQINNRLDQLQGDMSDLKYEMIQKSKDNTRLIGRLNEL